jgi:hypothetical protein
VGEACLRFGEPRRVHNLDLAHAGIVSMGGAIIAMCRLTGTDATGL